MFSTTGQTYNGKQAMEQILKPAIEYGALEDRFFKVLTGVKIKEQVFIMTPPSKITIKSQGCDPVSNNKNFTREEIFFDVQPVEARLDFCWTELYGQLEQGQLKGGTGVSDITNTKVESMILDGLVPAAHEDLIRIVWLADKSIVGANLTGGTPDVKNYDQINGFHKQVKAGVAASKVPYVAITQNTGATIAAQELPAGAAKGIFRKMYGKRDPLLRQVNNQLIYLTQDLYDNYYDELESNNALESARTMLLDGTKSLTYRGFPLVLEPILDKYIQSDFAITTSGNTAYTQPHRAYWTVKQNFQIAVDTDSNDPIAFETWYERKERRWYADMQYKLDARIAELKYVVAAY